MQTEKVCFYHVIRHVFSRHLYITVLGKVSVVVIDGITIGHPCCASHNCHEPLASNHHRYCLSHNTLNGKCAIVGCDEDIVEGSMMCSDPVHQEVEHIKNIRSKGRFQLKEQLECQRVPHPDDSATVDINVAELADVDAPEEGFLIDEEGCVVPDSLSYASEAGTERMISSEVDGNGIPVPVDEDEMATEREMSPNNSMDDKAPKPKKLQVQFGQKCTHNEQIIVCPCGIIIGRETFFGAEAVSIVIVSDLSCLVVENSRAPTQHRESGVNQANLQYQWLETRSHLL